MAHGSDQQFLRAISDHHLGMIEMAHAALRPDTSAELRAKAEQIHRKQHEEARQLAAMLKRTFGDRYQPTVTPDNQQLVERVRQAPGAAVERTFYEATIAHHEEGVRMIAEQRPHLSDPELRRMAERMHDDQRREVGELRQTLASR